MKVSFLNCSEGLGEHLNPRARPDGNEMAWLHLGPACVPIKSGLQIPLPQSPFSIHVRSSPSSPRGSHGRAIVYKQVQRRQHQSLEHSKPRDKAATSMTCTAPSMIEKRCSDMCDLSLIAKAYPLRAYDNFQRVEHHYYARSSG